MFKLITVTFLVFSASVHAGFFDDVNGVSSDVGNFFSRNFNNVKDLFVNNQADLETNVNRVKDLLIGIKEKAKMLAPMANDAQKETLRNVDNFLGRITNFEKDVTSQGQAAFNENKNKWQTMVTDIFEKGGVQNLLQILHINSAAGYSCAAIIAPVLYMFFAQ